MEDRRARNTLPQGAAGETQAQQNANQSLSPTKDDIVKMYCQQMSMMKQEYNKRLLELYETVSSSLEYIHNLQSMIPAGSTQLSGFQGSSASLGEKRTDDPVASATRSLGTSNMGAYLLTLFKESLESEKELKIQLLMDDLAKTKSIVDVIEEKLCDSMDTSRELGRELTEQKKQLEDNLSYTQNIKKKAASLEAELNALQPQLHSMNQLQEKMASLEKRSKTKQDEYKKQLSTLRIDVSKLESENALLKHDQVNVFQLRNELNDLRLKYNALYKEHQELQNTYSMAQYDLQAKTKALAAAKSASTHQILKEKAATDSIKVTVDTELKDQRKLLTALVEQVQQQSIDMKKLSAASAEEISTTLMHILERYRANIDRISATAMGSNPMPVGVPVFHGDPNLLYDYTGTPVTQQTYVPMTRHTEALKALEDEVWHRAESKYKSLLFNVESDLQRRLSEARDEFHQKEMQLKMQVQEALAKGTDKVQDDLAKLREECVNAKTLCSHKDLELERTAYMLSTAQAEIQRLQAMNNDLLQSAESYRQTLEYHENASKQTMSARSLARLCHEELQEIKRRILELKKTQFTPPEQREEQRLGDAELVFSAIAGELKLTSSGGSLSHVLTPIGNMIKNSVEYIKQQAIQINDERWISQMRQLEEEYRAQITYLASDNERLKQTILTLRDRMQIEVVKLLGIELTDMHDRCATQLDNLRYETEGMKAMLSDFLSRRPQQIAEVRLMSSPITVEDTVKATPTVYKTQAVTPGLLLGQTIPSLVTPGVPALETDKKNTSLH